MSGHGAGKYRLKSGKKDAAQTVDGMRIGVGGKALKYDARDAHTKWERDMQKSYAPAVEFRKMVKRDDGSRHTALPAVYDELHDDVDKTRLIGEAQKMAATQGATLEATLTPDLVDDMKKREEAVRTAEYHEWLHEQFDYRKPGMAAMLNKFEPSFIPSRIDVMKRDLGVEMTDRIINEFGIQSGADAQFKFAREKGLLKTQEEVRNDLYRNPPAGGNTGRWTKTSFGYVPGALYSWFRGPDTTLGAGQPIWDGVKHRWANPDWATGGEWPVRPGPRGDYVDGGPAAMYPGGGVFPARAHGVTGMAIGAHHHAGYEMGHGPGRMHYHASGLEWKVDANGVPEDPNILDNREGRTYYIQN